MWWARYIIGSWLLACLVGYMPESLYWLFLLHGEASWLYKRWIWAMFCWKLNDTMIRWTPVWEFLPWQKEKTSMPWLRPCLAAHQCVPAMMKRKKWKLDDMVTRWTHRNTGCSLQAENKYLHAMAEAMRSDAPMIEFLRGWKESQLQIRNPPAADLILLEPADIDLPNGCAAT